MTAVIEVAGTVCRGRGSLVSTLGRGVLRQLPRVWGFAGHRRRWCGFRIGAAAEGETWVPRNSRTEQVGRETCGSGCCPS